MKLFHNPRCSKSRAAVDLLTAKNIAFDVVYYLKEGIKKEDLEEILLKTNLKPADLIRTQEEYYKKELKGKSFTDDELKEIIVQNPQLLVRPIAIQGYRAVVAIPAEKIDSLL